MAQTAAQFKAKLLILGGTSEARALAQAVHDRHPDLTTVTSLAGVTTQPTALAGHVRVGGFGGVEGLIAYIKDVAITLVIDATHPFAARITDHAVRACAQTHTPYLRLDRPQWTVPNDTDVVFVPDADEAARLVARTSAAAMLTIGRKDLAAFAGVAKVKLVARVIEQPNPDPFAAPSVAQSVAPSVAPVTYVIARPPFTVDGEIALLRDHGIDTLVTKASGGDATRAKLDAAAKAGVRLVIIRRPPPPEAERVLTVADALGWLDAQI